MNKTILLHISLWLNWIFAIVFTFVFMQGDNWRFIVYLPWVFSLILIMIDWFAQND